MFTTPVAIHVTPENFNEVTQGLNKLGYSVSSGSNNDEYDPRWSYVITDYNGDNNQYGNFRPEPKHYVARSIPEFLALASLTDEPIKVGDWVVVLPVDEYYHNSEKCPQKVMSSTGGFLGYSLLFNKPSVSGKTKTNSYTHVRKATKEELIALFSNDGNKISPAEETLSTIPKYFIVKRDDSQEWKDYIQWLNKTYKAGWAGAYDYIGYDGNTEQDNGTNAWMSKEEFQNNPQVFTAKEFMNIVNKSKNMKRILKRNDFILLRNSISPTCSWYKRVTTAFADFAFKDEIEVPEELYADARREANSAQNALLDKVFGKDVKELNYQSIIDNIMIRGGNEYKHKGIYLPYQQDGIIYKIVIDGEGKQVLIAEYK